MQELDLIQVKGLSKEFRGYNSLWALKNINFSVKRGEFVAIIGENGAGKTTLLSLIAGIIAPTQGVIEAKGKITPFFDLLTGFHGDLTANENAYLYGSILGLSRKTIKERLDKIINFAGLENFQNVKLKYFSYGMLSRFSFSLVVHTDPEILLLDEVVVVGDGRFREKCLLMLKSLKKDGKTVIMSTLWLSIVRELCDRILVLEKGKQMAFGPTPQVLARTEKRTGDFFVCYKG